MHSGCAGYDEIVVGDTVDHVTRYVYDTKANTLVAVMEQTTIIETCLAGESWIAPPRSCDDPRNDPQTCCRPSPAGGLTCDAPQDAGP